MMKRRSVFPRVFAIIALLIVVLVLIAASFLLKKPQIDQYSNLRRNIVSKFQGASEIRLKNTLPLSDALGKTISIDQIDDGIKGYTQFYISNNSQVDTEYQIYLTKLSVDSDLINENYVKLYLSDDNGKPLPGFDTNIIPTFSDLRYLDDKPSSRLLYSSKIKAQTTEFFILRIWLADNYAISDSLHEFGFSVGVRNK